MAGRLSGGPGVGAQAPQPTDHKRTPGHRDGNPSGLSILSVPGALYQCNPHPTLEGGQFSHFTDE